MAEPNFKLIWKPEGASPREWAFNLGKPPWDLRVQTEKVTDWPWGVLQERFLNDSGIAMQAVLWVLRKRDEPKLALPSVIPDFDELEYEVLCPDCETWSSSDEDEHECAEADAEPADEDEAPKKSKKAAGAELGEA